MPEIRSADSAPFSDQQILLMCGYQNNCALNVIATQFANDLHTGLIGKKQLKTSVYQTILHKYRAYHRQPDATWEDLQPWLNQHIDEPLSIQLVLGPVMRLALGDVLKYHPVARRLFKQEFDMLFNAFLRMATQDPESIEPTDRLFAQSSAPYIEDLHAKFLQFQAEQQFEAGISLELQIDFISLELQIDLFFAQEQDNINAYINHEEGGFNRYIDSLCNPLNEATMGIEYAEYLAMAMGYEIKLFRGQDKTLWEGDAAASDMRPKDPLGTILFYNRNDAHYVGIAPDEKIASVHNTNYNSQNEIYDYLKLQCQGAELNALATQYQALTAQLNASALSQWLVGPEKPQQIFQQANQVLETALDNDFDYDNDLFSADDNAEQRFLILWNHLEGCVQTGDQSKLDQIDNSLKATCRPGR